MSISTAPPPRASAPSRKVTGATTIAHISDLHFQPSTDLNGARWAALRGDIQRHKVDFLAVTGDIVDNVIHLRDAEVRRALSAARKYLEMLCEAAAIDPLLQLAVVPGNHDYRPQGMFTSKALIGLFDEVLGPYFRPCQIPSLGLHVFTFNSNARRQFDLAAGLVDAADLVRFADSLATFSSVPESIPQTRVALIHHHPMPIAATEHRARLTDQDQYLLLQNAGTFMSEMVAADVDIILHGHKHHAAVSKATYFGDDGSEQDIVVVAAGSVGAGNPESYNLITISDSGQVITEQRAIGGANYERVTSREVRTYEQARERYWRRSTRDNALMRLERYQRYETITSSGDIETRELFQNVTAFDNKTIERAGLALRSRSGYFLERRYEDVSPGQHIRWVWRGKPTDTPRVGETIFEPPLINRPITYRRYGRTANAIFFNAVERRDYFADGTEAVSAINIDAIEHFELGVNFPSGEFPKQFTVNAFRPGGEPGLYELDLYETQYVNDRLTIHESVSMVILAFKRPLPKYKYQIAWQLPIDEATQLALSPVDAGRAQRIREQLISLRSEEEVRAAVTDQLRRFGATIESRPKSALRLLLAAYDATRQAIVAVATNDSKTYGQLTEWSCKTGRTIIGQAYRRKAPAACLRLRSIASPDLVYDEPILGQHQVIIALPFLYPAAGGERLAVLAAFADDPTSPLVSTYATPDAMNAYVTRAQAFWSDLLPVLTS